jgi:hypothetical protein
LDQATCTTLPATQGLAQEHLRLPAPVALGGVEVGDAGIEGGVHHGGGLTLVQSGAEVRIERRADVYRPL